MPNSSQETLSALQLGLHCVHGGQSEINWVREGLSRMRYAATHGEDSVHAESALLPRQQKESTPSRQKNKFTTTAHDKAQKPPHDRASAAAAAAAAAASFLEGRPGFEHSRLPKHAGESPCQNGDSRALPGSPTRGGITILDCLGCENGKMVIPTRRPRLMEVEGRRCFKFQTFPPPPPPQKKKKTVGE